jgi:hypothetical protein
VAPARNLYLHEYVDIVGEGAMPYMEHVVAFDAESAADRGIRLVGTWYTMGSTGRWPQVVNLWECAGAWGGWRRLMERTNLARTRNPALTEWWREALKTRSGGYDRLLGAAPGCPSLDYLRGNGITGSVFVHELSEVRPGAALDYLAAVRDDWAPVLTDYGHRMVGLYEVLLTDVEVITIWATDPAGHEALGRAGDEGSDDRIPRWRVRARQFLTRWREELMTPHPHNPLSAGDSL